MCTLAVFYLLHFPDFKVMPLFLVFGRLLLSYKSSHLNFCFLFILKFLYPIFLLNHMNTSVPLQPLSFFISNTLYSSLILYVGISPGLSSGERAINHATCHCVKCWKIAALTFHGSKSQLLLHVSLGRGSKDVLVLRNENHTICVHKLTLQII